MTRFARAKGSKASNERKEEDPTPWHIMRQQLAEQLNKNGSECEKKSFLSDYTTNMDVFKPKEEIWSLFSEVKFKKSNFIRDTKTLEKLSKNQGEKDKTKVSSILNDVCSSKTKDSSVKTVTKPQKSLNKIKKGKNTESQSKKIILKGNISKHCKSLAINKSKQNKRITDNWTIETNKKTTAVEKNEVMGCNSDHVKKSNSKIDAESSRKKLKINKFKTLKDANTEQEQTKLTPPESFDFKTVHTLKNPKQFKPNVTKHDNKETNKKSFKKEFQRVSYKNSHNHVETIIANGRKIEVVKFEAFWIKKEDAGKLKELKKKLRSQNMPNDQIKTIMKLERRKAEKALSREKNNVCYHCRKFGHKFSECPDIDDSSMSKSDICFKCGSTEHTHFECKVIQSQIFRYAVCFVCNEQGHIARQCSLNSQGQYPKGGSCHLCGEVTHLRKDCPKAFEEKPSNYATVEKINSVGLEDVSSEMQINNKKQNLVRNKIVQF